MKIQSDDIKIIIDPLSSAGGYKLLSGSLSQTYDNGLNVYNPSREFVPLVILPWVSIVDENNKYTGERELTGVDCVVEFSDGTPVPEVLGYDVATTPEDAGLSSIVKDSPDIDVPSAPKWSIIYKQDVAPMYPVRLHVTAKFADPQTGAQGTYTFDVELTTNTLDTEILELVDVRVASQDKDMTIDPVRAADDAIPLSVQLYRNRKVGAANDGLVADANAIYTWEMQMNDDWVVVTPYNQVFIQEQTIGKAITLGLDYFDQVKLRVRAEYAPAGVGSGNFSPYIYYSLRRVQAPNTNGRVVPDAGGKTQMDSIIKRHIVLTDREGDLTSALLNKYYSITWKRRVAGSSTEYLIQEGESMLALASDLGLTMTNTVSILPHVYRKLCYKPLMNGNKAVTRNGKIIVVQNKTEI